jgi:PST family polysaccharide transporter
VSLKAVAARGIIWTAVEGWGRQFLGLAVFTILARLLDKEAFGLVALAGVYMAFVQMFVKEGLGAAVVQRKELKPSHVDAAFWGNVVLALLLAALTITFRSELAVILENEKLAPILAWLAIGMLLTAVSIVPEALLTREMKFKSLAIRTMAGTTAGGCVGVGLAVFGFGVWSLVAQQIVGAAVGMACLWANVRWRPRIQANWAAFADLASFFAGVLGHNLLWFISTRVDQAVIGTGLGVAALGAYVVAQRVISLVTEMLTLPMQSVAMPAFSKIQDDPERLARTFVWSTTLVCALALPAFLAMLLIGPHLIPMVLGAKWESAIVPMQILCVAGMLRAAQTFVHPTYMALGRVVLLMWVFGLDAAVSAIGCWLAATHGMASVAWAVVVAAGVTGVVNLLVLSRLVRLSFASLTTKMWPTLVACGIMALAVLGTERVLGGRIHDLILVVVQTVVGAASFGTAFALLARELWSELWSIAKLMRSQKQEMQQRVEQNSGA